MTSKTGHCLCGAVRFTLKDEHTSFAACHCSMCRRWSGGVHFGIQTDVDGVSFEGGEALKTYKSSEWAERAFCDTCGTHIYWKLTAPGPMQGMMILTPGALDDMDGMVLDHEVYIDHKPAGYAFAGDTKKLTEADLMAMMTGDDGQGESE